jgi:hypothetical protein
MEKTRGWIERAHETGNWGQHEKKARRQLAKSGVQIRTSRKTKQPDRHEPDREDLRDRSAPGAAPPEDDLRHEEYVEDCIEEHEDALPSDEEESVVAEPAGASVVTLSSAYDAYQTHGGNRRIPDRALVELGEVPIEDIDRATIIATARRLYPHSSQSERAELFIDPMEEILGLARSRAAPKPEIPVATKQRRLGPLPEYWFLRKAEIEAAQEKFVAMLEERFAAAAAREPDPGEWYRYEDHCESDWASVKPVGSPSDPPPERDNGWRPIRTNELYRWSHRGQLSKLHGTDIRFGPRRLDSHGKLVGRPVYVQSGRTGDGIYIGYESAPVGRPRKNKSEQERKRDNAARQRLFRDRRKGKRNGKETS